jgi:hypothetical protein
VTLRLILNILAVGGTSVFTGALLTIGLTLGSCWEELAAGRIPRLVLSEQPFRCKDAASLCRCEPSRLGKYVRERAEAVLYVFGLSGRLSKVRLSR